MDLAKAYDYVEWEFLLTIIHLMNFSLQFCAWVKECVTTTPHYFIKVNGHLDNFFQDSRGLRQEDPLSTYLFVLV